MEFYYQFVSILHHYILYDFYMYIYIYIYSIFLSNITFTIVNAYLPDLMISI